MEVAASDGFYMGFDSANYTGTVTKEFSFEYAVELDKDTYDYTGNSIIPEVTVTLNDIVLANGTDYTVTCKNNTILGTAGVKITGKDVYMATLNAEKEFTIAVAQTEGEVYEISLDKDSYSFTGWLVYPTVTVTKNGTALIEGTDYTVDYPVAVRMMTIRSRGMVSRMIIRTAM